MNFFTPACDCRVMKDLRAIREEVLVLGCQGGDEESFRKLVELMEARLFYFVRGLVANDQVALDVMQEVWIKVFRKIRSLRELPAFRRWIFRIAHDTAVSAIRKERVRRSEPLDGVDPKKLQKEEPDLLGFDPSDVHRAMAELSLNHRKVLSLFYFEGLTYSDIAEVVGAPIGVVRSRLHYAKKAMEGILTRGEEHESA